MFSSFFFFCIFINKLYFTILYFKQKFLNFNMLTSNFIILTHDREHLLYVLGFDFPKLNAHGQWSIILRERERGTVMKKEREKGMLNGAIRLTELKRGWRCIYNHGCYKIWVAQIHCPIISSLIISPPPELGDPLPTMAFSFHL